MENKTDFVVFKHGG